jgi:hypothetical protein
MPGFRLLQPIAPRLAVLSGRSAGLPLDGFGCVRQRAGRVTLQPSSIGHDPEVPR